MFREGTRNAQNIAGECGKPRLARGCLLSCAEFSISWLSCLVLHQGITVQNIMPAPWQWLLWAVRTRPCLRRCTANMDHLVSCRGETGNLTEPFLLHLHGTILPRPGPAHKTGVYFSVIKRALVLKFCLFIPLLVSLLLFSWFVPNSSVNIKIYIHLCDRTVESYFNSSRYGGRDRI
jgi:hypothetical protein